MDILGMDYPCMDMNLLCDRMPAEGELVEMRRLSLQGGGKVPNALIAAARLGSRCGIIGVTGNDRYGRACKEDLRAHGVDTAFLRCEAGHTALCVSIVAAGEKHYIEHPPTHPRLRESDVDEAYLAQAKCLLLYQLDEAALLAARLARKHGVMVAIDADEYDPRVMTYLQQIDVLIASEYFYRALYADGSDADNLRRLSDTGPRTVVVTLGERGSIGVENGAFFQADAYRVSSVVDTTGAGDVFHGAFCHYLCGGLSAKEAAQRAGAVSAIKCTVFGGRAGIPDERITRGFIETGVIDGQALAQRARAYEESAWQ